MLDVITSIIRILGAVAWIALIIFHTNGISVAHKEKDLYDMLYHGIFMILLILMGM